MIDALIEQIRRDPLRALAWVIATGFGTGLSPVAPGTVGSLAAAVLYYLSPLDAGSLTYLDDPALLVNHVNRLPLGAVRMKGCDLSGCDLSGCGIGQGIWVGLCDIDDIAEVGEGLNRDRTERTVVRHQERVFAYAEVG